MDAVLDDPTTRIVVDLANRAVSAPGVAEVFELDDYTHRRLLEGLDDIGLTLLQESKITDFEVRRPAFLPSI
jgi:3-isopropylmalate/(R)-2-methylmalate dehydratase small subunit